MNIPRSCRAGLCLGLVTTSVTFAHDPKAQPAASPAATATTSEAGAGAAAAVESFHAALAAGDREGALSWLDPQVVIFESGGAEMSREEYASHHLESDMEFVRAMKTEVVDRQAHSAADAAWVLTRTRTTGRFRDRDFDLDGVETMVLRRTGDRWRIIHVHWSSSSRKSG